MSKMINWGILGPGRIATNFASDLITLTDAKLLGVASTNKDRAEIFANKYGATRSYGSYKALLDDKDIDAVYISTINTKHYEVVIECLNAGKAVLCEKPMGLNVKQTSAMIRKAEEKGLFLMEAYWSRFLPAYRKVKEWIAAGKIGEPRRLTADFSFLMEPDPQARHFDPAQGGGALLDVGIYLLGPAFDIFGKSTRAITSAVDLSDTGVDQAFSITMDFGSGRFADLFGSFCCPAPFDAMIYGTTGKIHIPDFWMASSAFLYNTDGTVADSIEDSKQGTGYRYEAIEVGQCLQKGKTESELMNHSNSLLIAEKMDLLRAEWGVKYPGE